LIPIRWLVAGAGGLAPWRRRRRADLVSTGFNALRAPDTPEMEKKYFTQWRLVRSSLFQLDTMEVLVSLLASGACEKYPDFNFVLGDSGVTWLLYVFDRLDTEYADRARSLNFKLKPSDYFRRQG
jgi:hypothetical protein